MRTLHVGLRVADADRSLASYTGVGFTVHYELTELGLSLQEVMHGIKDWVEAHMDEVLANRDGYDTRPA